MGAACGLLRTMRAAALAWLALGTTAALAAAPPAGQAPPPTKLFVCGLGYCGLRAAAAWHEAYPECVISGSVRSREKVDALQARFPWLEAHTFDLDENYVGLDDGGRTALAAASHVLQTMPPIADLNQDPLLALHGAALRESDRLVSAAYLSSTGVYGDHGGDWVDEDSELRPGDPKSAARIPAEAAWLALGLEERPGRPACTVSVYRLGGIYGSGRSLLDQARKKEAPAPLSGKPAYVNRIYVEDIAGALVVGAARRGLSRVYNLVDDDPAPRSDMISLARRLLGLTEAESEELPAATGGRRMRSAGSKRVRNGRLRGDLAYEFRAPTYREGLALLLEAELGLA